MLYPGLIFNWLCENFFDFVLLGVPVLGKRNYALRLASVAARSAVARSSLGYQVSGTGTQTRAKERHGDTKPGMSSWCGAWSTLFSMSYGLRTTWANSR